MKKIPLEALGVVVVVIFIVVYLTNYFVLRDPPKKNTIYQKPPTSYMESILKLFKPKDTLTTNKTPVGTDDYYFKDTSGNIYWNYKGGGLFPTKPYFYKIEEADSDTFEELSCGIKNGGPLVNCEIGFARDKNYVYHKGYILKNVDPSTFQFLSVNNCMPENPCFSDKNNIYIMTGDFDFVSQ